MADAGRTYDMTVGFGDTGFMADLTEQFQGGSMNGSVSGERAAYNGTRYTDYVATAAKMDPDFGTLYAGAEIDTLRARLPFSTDPYGFFIGDDFFYIGRTFIPGMPEAGPTTGIITAAIPAMASSADTFRGGQGAAAVTEIDRDASSSGTIPIGAIPAEAERYLVVTEYTAGISSAEVTVTGSAAQAVGGAGVWKIPSVAGVTAAATITVAPALSGDQVIKGFVLIGEELGLG